MRCWGSGKLLSASNIYFNIDMNNEATKATWATEKDKVCCQISHDQHRERFSLPLEIS
jgi:hypothetical protein